MEPLALRNDEVPARSALLAKVHLPQNAGKRGVARPRLGVQHAVNRNQARARIGKHNPVLVQRDERPGRGIRNVLVDDRICQKLSDSPLRVGIHNASERPIDLLLRRQLRHHVLGRLGKRGGIALVKRLV